MQGLIKDIAINLFSTSLWTIGGLLVHLTFLKKSNQYHFSCTGNKKNPFPNVAS